MTPRILRAPAAALLAFGAVHAFQAGAPPEELPATVTLTGSFSKVTTGRLERITDAARWEAVWREHRGETIEKNANGFDTWPGVDFERYMVIAVFRGAAKNTSEWKLVSWVDRPKDVLVRYDAIGFQTASFNGPDHGVDTTAWGFFVLPRTAKEIVLEENVQGLIGGPPKWKEQKRFPAIPR